MKKGRFVPVLYLFFSIILLFCAVAFSVFVYHELTKSTESGIGHYVIIGLFSVLVLVLLFAAFSCADISVYYSTAKVFWDNDFIVFSWSNLSIRKPPIDTVTDRIPLNSIIHVDADWSRTAGIAFTYIIDLSKCGSSIQSRLNEPSLDFWKIKFPGLSLGYLGYGFAYFPEVLNYTKEIIEKNHLNISGKTKQYLDRSKK